MTNIISTMGHNWFDLLIALIIGLFSAGGLSALLKSRKEGSKILIDAAQGAVVVQTSVMKNLQEQLENQQQKSDEVEAELRAEIAELRTHLAELNSLRTRIREVEQNNEVLIAENTMLKSQVKALSKMVYEQEKRNGVATPPLDSDTHRSNQTT